MATQLPTRQYEASEVETVNKVRTLFSYAKSFRSRRIEWWRRAYQLIHNRSWNPARDAWLPSPTASEVHPIIAALVAWMTDQRTALFLSPAADPGSPVFPVYSQLCHDLEKVIEANFENRKTDQQIEMMLWDGFTYGTGILKTGWDAALEEGMGDGIITRVDPFKFYPDPNASSMEDSNYFIEAATMSMQELERRYPHAPSLIFGNAEQGSLDERPQLYDQGRAPMANPAGLFGNAPRYGLPGGDSGRASLAVGYDQGITVYEAWIRENDLWTDPKEEEGEIHVDDHWRCVTVAGNQVMMDEPAENLFGHGRHPYTRYVPTDIGEFWGVSLVEHLAPLQISLNRLLAAIQQNAELTGNPVFFEESRSGIQRTKIINRPGQRVSYNAGSTAEWKQPPAMTPQAMELINFYLNEMERISGLSAIVRGNMPKGRNAQGVMDSVQEAAFVRVRMALRNLERTERESGQLLAELIAENYTTPRIIALTGEQNATPIVLKSRHFYIPNDIGEEPLKFSMRVEAGASMPTSRQARSAEADKLFAMGAIDREAELDAHEYPNRQQILKRIDVAIQSGTFAPPGGRKRAR